MQSKNQLTSFQPTPLFFLRESGNYSSKSSVSVLATLVKKSSQHSSHSHLLLPPPTPLSPHPAADGGGNWGSLPSGGNAIWGQCRLGAMQTGGNADWGQCRRTHKHVWHIDCFVVCFNVWIFVTASCRVRTKLCRVVEYGEVKLGVEEGKE